MPRQRGRLEHMLLPRSRRQPWPPTRCIRLHNVRVRDRETWDLERLVHRVLRLAQLEDLLGMVGGELAKSGDRFGEAGEVESSGELKDALGERLVGIESVERARDEDPQMVKERGAAVLQGGSRHGCRRGRFEGG